VFEYGDGTVIKLFRPDYDFALDMEVERTRAVHDAGIAAPAVMGVITVNGRRGIVMERLDGPTLLEDLVARRQHAKTTGALTAEVHVAIHRSTANLPRLASATDAPDPSHGDSLLHLDLHPGNVLATSSRLVVIDWVNAHLGPPGADVARSVMAIRYQALGVRGAIVTEREVRQAVLDGYLNRYRELAGLPPDLEAWLARAAVSLLEHEPDNPDALQLSAFVAAVLPAADGE
jgi:aminoglycoside phosphotransferase (APT) family kinase protein